jgi:glycosyltransferase involved in cell wall biosynthesis
MLDVVMIGPFPADPSVIKGGVQASVYGLSRTLQKRSDIGGVDVFSIPVKADKTPLHSATVEGIAVTYLNAPYRFLISLIIHVSLVFRTIRRKRNPVVHVHGTGLFQAVLLICLRIRRTPLVWTLHGITEKETLEILRRHRTIGNLLRNLLYTFLERVSLRIAPFTIVDTPYVEQELAPTRNKLYVIPQGIFADEFTGLPHERPDPPEVLSIGVLSPRKGHHLTLEAFPRIKPKLPTARLIIAGASPQPDYVQSLNDRSAELGLTDSVEIRVDLPRTEILALLGRSHVFALHSQEESQGIALCEALAAGLPVVATRVGGIPFVVDDQQNGFLVPYGDIQAFADTIILLLTEESRHAQMSARAKVSADRFNWTRIANEVFKIYELARTNADQYARQIADCEGVIQEYVRAGWTWNHSEGLLTDPHDNECIIHVDMLTQNVALSVEMSA